MLCPQCGTRIVDTDSPHPVNPKLNSQRKNFRIPFHCDHCGAIQFNLQAVRDVVYLYPIPKPEKIGSIHIPDYDGRSYNTQELFRSPCGIVLSFGFGAYDKQGKLHRSLDIEVGDLVLYNKQVPWSTEMVGGDGQKHKVVFCGYQDLKALVTDESLVDALTALPSEREFADIPSRR